MLNLDLHRIFKINAEAREAARKDEENDVQIVGYVISKEDKVPEIEAALKEAGVNIEFSEEQGDALILKQDKDADAKDEENVVVKMSDDFIVVLKGFDPYSMTAEMSFGEIIKSQGFMPGFSMATDALYTSIRNSLVEADDQKDAVSKIDEAVQEFHDYIVGLAQSIPQNAFKAMEMFHKAKAGYWEKKNKNKDSDAAMEEEEAKMKAKTKKEADDKAAAEAAKKAEEEAKAKKAEGGENGGKPAQNNEGATGIDPEKLTEVVTGAVATALKAVSEGMSKQLGEFSEVIKATQKGFDDLKATVDQAAADAQEAKEIAQKTEKTLSGTLIGGSPSGDPEDDEDRVNKGEGAIGCFDTAFNKQVRKVDVARGKRPTHML